MTSPRAILSLKVSFHLIVVSKYISELQSVSGERGLTTCSGQKFKSSVGAGGEDLSRKGDWTDARQW